MKYLFRQDKKGGHVRTVDGVRGVLKELPDTATVQPATALVDPAGFIPYSEPTPEPPTPEPTPEPVPPTQAECIALGEQHVLNAGITGFRLAALQNRLLETKAACEAATPPIDIAVAKPKMVTLYTWLKTVEAMAVAGQTAFPPAPHTFEEVVSE